MGLDPKSLHSPAEHQVMSGRDRVPAPWLGSSTARSERAPRPGLRGDGGAAGRGAGRMSPSGAMASRGVVASREPLIPRPAPLITQGPDRRAGG